MEKILTIVIPTYNMEKYLDRCLSSLVIDDEMMDRLEVLVVNDGSKDRSSEIAHGYESRYPRTFRVIDKENGNYGSCVNRGLAEATGKYIKVLDADDWFSSNFQSFIAFLSGVDTDLVISDFDFVLDDGSITKSVTYNFPIRTDLPLSELLVCQEMWMHAVTYRTDNLKRIGYVQTEGISYTDQEWIFYPMKTVESFRYYNNSLYQYLLGREGQTVDMSVWLKNARQEVMGANVMLNQYDENRSDVSADVLAYWENRMIQRSKVIYRGILLSNLSYCIQDSGIYQYDARLATVCPRVYQFLAGEKVSNKFNYLFVAEWRKMNYSRPFRLKSIVVMKTIRNLVLKVIGI